MTKHTKLPLKKLFLWLVLVSLGITALIGILVFLFGSFGEIEGKILASTSAIGGFSLTGLACSILLTHNRYKWFANTGIIISTLGLIYTLLLIWEPIDFEGWEGHAFKPFLLLIILAITFAHSCLLLLMQPAQRKVKLALTATLICIGIVSTMLTALILFEFDVPDIFVRLLGVFAILDVLGTIATPLLPRLLQK